MWQINIQFKHSCGEWRALEALTRGIVRISLLLYTVKKRLAVFLSPAGVSLTKLSLDGNNQIFPVQGEFGK
jgi:hypothetical protein